MDSGSCYQCRLEKNYGSFNFACIEFWKLPFSGDLL